MSYHFLLHFTGNYVQKYDTDPMVDPRVSEAALGTGGTTYVTSTYLATYNIADDLVYVNCTKDTGGGPVAGMLVLDPRTLTIVRETAGKQFIDVQDDTIWGIDGSDLVAWDSVTFAEVFRYAQTAGSTITGLDGIYEFEQGAGSRCAMFFDYDTNTPAVTAAILTITSTTTYSAATVELDGSVVGWWGTLTPATARPYIATGTKMWLQAIDGGDAGIVGAILNSATMAVTYVYNPGGHDYGATDIGSLGEKVPYWDSTSNKILFRSKSIIDDNYCMVGVDVLTATIDGEYAGATGGSSATDWYDGKGLVLGTGIGATNEDNTDIGVFDYDTPDTRTATEILTTSSVDCGTSDEFGAPGFGGEGFVVYNVVSIPPSLDLGADADVEELGDFVEDEELAVASEMAEAGDFTDELFSEPLDFVDEFGLFTNAMGETEDYIWEHGLFTDSIGIGETDVLTDDGMFTDGYEENPAYLLVETGTFSTATEAPSLFHNDIVETGTFANEFELRLPQTATSNGTFTDAASLAVATEYGTVGTFTATATQNVTNWSVTAVNTGTFSDASVVGVAQETSDSGSFTDEYENEYTIIQLVEEAGAFTDEQDLFLTTTTLVAESGIFVVTAYTILAATLTNVVETGYFTDYTLGGGATGAWTTHLETFAMSRYTDFPFTSMAVVDGVLLGTNENGVYRLDAATDAGVAIAARVVHDWSDDVPDRNGELHSNEYLKHARYLYIGATAGGRIGFTLGYINAAGAEASATYSFLFATQGGYSTNRASLGRGVRSRFTQPTLFNIDGADFAINDATLVVELSNRRM